MPILDSQSLIEEELNKEQKKKKAPVEFVKGLMSNANPVFKMHERTSRGK